MALSVPLSRFTPRVGGGSAFFVSLHRTSLVKCQRANQKQTRDSSAHGAPTDGLPSRIGFGVEVGLRKSARNSPVSSAISPSATHARDFTLITEATKRLRSMRLLQWIRIPSPSGAGIRCLRNGGFGTYTLRVTTTGLRLVVVATESGSSESRRIQANKSLQATAAAPTSCD